LTWYEKVSKRILTLTESITNKRAKIVINHIINHGFITTEDLEKTYGYNHPPRAARDVREAGIPLETFRTKSADGKSIAAYRFGDISKIRNNRVDGRQVFSKELKNHYTMQITDIAIFVMVNSKKDICRLTTEPPMR